VQIVLESKPHPEMGYRACLGIMGLAKTYTAARLEAASQRALLLPRALLPEPEIDSEAIARPANRPRTGTSREAGPEA